MMFKFIVKRTKPKLTKQNILQGLKANALYDDNTEEEETLPLCKTVQC